MCWYLVERSHPQNNFSFFQLRTPQQSTVSTDYRTNYCKSYLFFLDLSHLKSLRSTYIPIILPPWVDYSYFLFSSFLALSWNYVIKREVTVPLPREMVIYLTSSGHSFFVHSICRVSLFEKYILIILPYSIGYFCLSLSVFTGVIYLKDTPGF